MPGHDLREGVLNTAPPPQAWGTPREEVGIKENIPWVFLQNCFCVWCLGEFSYLLKRGKSVGFKARPLIFSRCYLPCQVLGLNFSDAQGLGFGRPSLTTLPPPPSAQLTAGGQLSLGALARFLSRAPGGSRRARGPTCPGMPSCRLGRSARANTMNKVGRPRQEGRITRETPTAVPETKRRRKKESILPNMGTSVTFSQTLREQDKGTEAERAFPRRGSLAA